MFSSHCPWMRGKPWWSFGACKTAKDYGSIDRSAGWVWVDYMSGRLWRSLSICCAIHHVSLDALFWLLFAGESVGARCQAACTFILRQEVLLLAQHISCDILCNARRILPFCCSRFSAENLNATALLLALNELGNLYSLAFLDDHWSLRLR